MFGSSSYLFSARTKEESKSMASGDGLSEGTPYTMRFRTARGNVSRFAFGRRSEPASAAPAAAAPPTAPPTATAAVRGGEGGTGESESSQGNTYSASEEETNKRRRVRVVGLPSATTTCPAQQAREAAAVAGPVTSVVGGAVRDPSRCNHGKPKTPGSRSSRGKPRGGRRRHGREGGATVTDQHQHQNQQVEQQVEQPVEQQDHQQQQQQRQQFDTPPSGGGDQGAQRLQGATPFSFFFRGSAFHGHGHGVRPRCMQLQYQHQQEHQQPQQHEPQRVRAPAPAPAALRGAFTGAVTL
eukprot:g12687.t1